MLRTWLAFLLTAVLAPDLAKGDVRKVIADNFNVQSDRLYVNLPPKPGTWPGAVFALPLFVPITRADGNDSALTRGAQVHISITDEVDLSGSAKASGATWFSAAAKAGDIASVTISFPDARVVDIDLATLYERVRNSSSVRDAVRYGVSPLIIFRAYEGTPVFTLNRKAGASGEVWGKMQRSVAEAGVSASVATESKLEYSADTRFVFAFEVMKVEFDPKELLKGIFNPKLAAAPAAAVPTVLLAREDTIEVSQRDAILIPQTGPKAEAIKKNLTRIKLPQGFKIGLFAIVPDARHMAVGPQGIVTFVGTRKNKVWAVTDDGKSHVANEVKEFASSIPLTIPNGVCFSKDGSLFIAEQNRVLRFPAAEFFSKQPEAIAFPAVQQGELIPSEEESYNHTARVCRVGPDEKLYVTLGQPFNVFAPEKMDLYKRIGIGGIIRMSTEGTDREVFAWGVRNSVGMDFNPKDKTLWFTDNQVDGMGDDQPPGEINRANRPGMNFGFPYYGGGKTRTNEYKDQQPPADATFPQVEMVAHAADLGMTFYSGRMFPQKYRGGIFSAQHGSWNRTVPVGARVMFTSLKEDGTADKTEPFAEGWLTENGEYLGRPVDVAQLPDGSILVSDDFAGAIYRIWYDGR